MRLPGKELGLKTACQSRAQDAVQGKGNGLCNLLHRSIDIKMWAGPSTGDGLQFLSFLTQALTPISQNFSLPFYK